MTSVKILLLAGLFAVNFAMADKKNPGKVNGAVTPKAVQQTVKDQTVTKQTPVDDVTKPVDGNTNPRSTIHITPGSATKFDNNTNAKGTGERPTLEEAQREPEEIGKLSAGVIKRNQDATQLGLYDDESFNSATGRLAELMAKEKTKSLSAEEQAELTKLKLEIAEMLKVQAELDTRGKGSPPAEMVKKVSEILDAVEKRKAEINKAVAEARANGKIVPQEAVDNLLRNAVDTYAGLGFHGGKKGTELLGLNKALENLTKLQGDQLVGYIKYLDAYGSSYRKARADGQSEESAHKIAAASRNKFVDDRAQQAKVEPLRDKENLRKKLCECTGACAA